jgi:hypothetical protein
MRLFVQRARLYLWSARDGAERSRRFCGLQSAFILIAVFILVLPGIWAATLPEALSLAQNAYEQARTNYTANPNDPSAAANLARTCFELAELSSNSQQRAALANEGIAAAQFATENAPDLAAGHFYLALNLGELARTKSLGALSLLRRMERALLKTVELDPHIEHAGPDRSLGMLYLEAPGWPMSVGNKRKAREHLQRSVALEADYPDNHLSLLEAYVRWKDEAALRAGVDHFRKILTQARTKYSGARWQQAWHDWEERWEAVLKVVDEE